MMSSVSRSSSSGGSFEPRPTAGVLGAASGGLASVMSNSRATLLIGEKHSSHECNRHYKIKPYHPLHQRKLASNAGQLGLKVGDAVFVASDLLGGFLSIVLISPRLL